MRSTIFVASAALVGIAEVSAAQNAVQLVPGDTEASTQLTQIVESTRQSGLPVDPILAKVQYGIHIVHAPPDKIVASARAIASRLEVARTVLAPATSNDIIAGADALGVGATKDALQAVREASGNKSVVTPLNVLAQLIVSKVPVSRATEIVTTLVRRGASADQLMALGNNVNDDVHRGVAALAALDARARFLSGVLAPIGSQAGGVTGLTSASAPGPRKP